MTREEELIAAQKEEQRIKNEEQTKKQIAYANKCNTPPRGFTFNPLIRFGRNRSCFCGSGTKFKHCHLKGLPKIVREEDARVFEEMIKSLGKEHD